MRNLVGGVMTPPYGALNNILEKHGCCLHRLMQAAGGGYTRNGIYSYSSLVTTSTTVLAKSLNTL